MIDLEKENFVLIRFLQFITLTPLYIFIHARKLLHMVISITMTSTIVDQFLNFVWRYGDKK